MVWCSYCARDQEVEADDVNGFTYCTGCGRVLDDSVFSSEPTFLKGADGSSQLQGNYVKERQYRNYGSDGHMYATASHEKTLEKGRNEISDIADYLAMGGRDDAVNAAHRLYIIAVERNFTKGRRTNQVAAACLYIICRQEQKPFLLIDFSDCLQISVYVLGAVFLQLCRLLSLEQHPIMQKPVDPSLFIHRFADRLLRRSSAHEKKFHPIANMALRLVASMKRDWMQTGRRPSGICGAALFISAHVHGFECTKTDVVSVVHICEGTLTKRLIEFENTESGSLTPEEFEERAKEYEVLLQTIQPPKVTGKDDDKREVLCEHKDLGVEHFAVGLCKACYEEFIRVSGGLEGGAAPPAFQVAERKREEAEKELLKQKAIEGSEQCDKQIEGEPATDKVKSKQKCLSDSADEIDASSRKETTEIDGSQKDDDFGSQKDGSDILKSAVDESQTLTEKSKISAFDDFEEVDDDDTFSDIDDDEVNTYLHNDEEVRLKTLIWTEMNKEYLEEQQAKQEALAASEAARAAILASAGEDSVKLAAAAAAAVAELKKDRKRKRDEAKSRGPAETATEAARQMLQNKKLSSKVNYDALDTLFDGEDASKKKSDVKETNAAKEKHVSWADSDITDIGSKNEQKDSNKNPKGSPEKDEDDDEDDDDEEGDANNDDVEIDQISGYGYADYAGGDGDDYADYGDDGYDEY